MRPITRINKYILTARTVENTILKYDTQKRFPTTIVIGKDGLIKEYFSGSIIDFSVFKQRLIELPDDK